MALDCAVGTLNTGTGTSNVSVTGLSFQPKVVIFLGTISTGTGNASSCNIGMGWATSSTQRGCTFFHSRDNQATSSVGCQVRTDACFGLRAEDNSVNDGLLDFVSFNADGFTVVPDDAFIGNYVVGWMALGGSSLTNVIAGSFTAPTTTGTFDTTDAGFQPTSLLLLGASRNVTAFATAVTNIAGIMFGATDGTNSRCLSFVAHGGQATATTASIMRNDGILNAIADGSSTNLYTFDSFLSNGFRLNKTDGSAGHVCLYLAMAGASVKVSDFNHHTTTGNYSVSSVGFKPAGLITVASRQQSTYLTANASDIRASFGFAASSTQRVALGVTEDDPADPTVSSHNLQTTRLVVHDTVTEPHTLDSDIDFVSFDTDGYTLNQVTRGGVSQLFGIAVGPAAAAGGSTNNYFYRRRLRSG